MERRLVLLCAGLALAAGCDSPSQCAGLSCDDGNPCTDDTCVEGKGCVHAPNTASCDACGDDACCTSACSEGTCKATPHAPVCDGKCDGDCDRAACPDDCAAPQCPGGCPDGQVCIALPGGDAAVVFGCAPEKETDCGNGKDDDFDTWTDCKDPDCAQDPACKAAEVCDNSKDDDGDGRTDCDDADCAAEPKCAPLTEVCDNSKDDDGDGRTDCEDADCAAEPKCTPPPKEICDDAVDQDGDGKTDCDDPDCAAEPTCLPPPPEVCDNTLDDDGDGQTDCGDPDCAGRDPCIQVADPGEVVIVEIMANPAKVADSAGQWIELLNTSAGDIDLAGWVLHDLDPVSPTWHVIHGRPVVIKAGGLLVLGASTDQAVNGGANVDYAWSNYSLATDADEVVLEVKAERIDTVKYSSPTWPLTEGHSLALDSGNQTAAANDDPLAWCAGSSQYNGVDFGTPGAANPACP